MDSPCGNVINVSLWLSQISTRDMLRGCMRPGTRTKKKEKEMGKEEEKISRNKAVGTATATMMITKAEVVRGWMILITSTRKAL